MSCLIGITCGWLETETWHTLRDYYVLAVRAAGGLPVLLPTMDPELAQEIYHRVDGLIFSGGGDPDPLYYGEEPLTGLGEVTPRRDRFELALAKEALGGRKPVLAICRGIQIINIAAGGTLYQDLKAFTSQEHSQRAPKWYATHCVDISEESRLCQILQKESIRVNSFHHQGIKQLGHGLKTAAKSKDGLIEAVEAEDAGRFLIGVQWHPECSWDRDAHSFNLFSAFIREAKNKLNAKA